MTLSPWIIYLWGIADIINHTTALVSMITGLLLLILTVLYLVAKHDNEDDFAKKIPIKSVGCMFVVLLSINTLFPSSKTIAVMVVAPAIVNSDPIQKDLPELYKAAKDALMGTLEKK